MKISDRDKLLILVVVFIALIALPIFLFIRPKNEKIKGMDAELVSLNERYNYLKDLSEKQPFYEAEIARLNEERTNLINGFAEGLKQENTIMFLRNIEKDFPLKMTTETFSAYEETPVTDGAVNPSTGQVEGDLTALKTSTVVSYTCEYPQFKKLLDYVFKNEDKMTISAITATYNPDTAKLEGAFTFDEYAFIGSGREVETLPIPTLDRGHNTHPFALFERRWVNDKGDRIDMLDDEAKAAEEEQVEETTVE